MKKNYIFLALILSFSFFNLFGQQVNEKEAIYFVNNWLNKKSTFHEIDTIIPYISNNRTILFYCLLNPNGYIIISGDKSLSPIIGYSLDNELNLDNLPPPLKFSIDNYKKKVPNSQEIKRNKHPEWNISKKSSKSTLKSITPLIKTQWNQGYPYNTFCPNNTPAGCVAIAIAQLMKYYDYPSHGLKENSYQSTYGYGTLYADFKNTSYNWNEMTNTASVPNEDIARIIYHSGISVNMNYSPTSSSASSGKVIDAFVDYFGYNKTSEEVLFTTQDAVSWKTNLINQLDNSHPIIYSGSTEVNFGDSHMFLIDGYDDNGLFHINWGWGGSGDGYYNLNEIDWQYRQRAYYNVYPPQLRAEFEVDTLSGLPPFTVKFTDYSLNKTEPITKWEWDFDNDGIIDSENQNPSKTYNQFDLYSVKLIISNDSYSDTIVKSDLITAACPITPKNVSNTGSDVTGTGSFTKPFRTIQRAVDLSFKNNDTIIVDNGKYFENIDFNGKNIMLTSNFIFSDNYIDIIETIIDGNNSGSVMNFDNGENENTKIVGFTLQNGSGDYLQPHWVAPGNKRYLGGGIRCDNNSSPSLKYLIIKNNTAMHGSAIYTAQDSNIYLSNSIIHNNSGSSASLFLHRSDIKIDSTYIVENDGAGIYSASGNVSKINHCVIANNGGGGYRESGLHYDYGSKGILNNSIVYNNKSGVNLGGIYMHVSDLKIVNSIVYNNYPNEVVFSESITCGPNYFTITHSNIKGGQNSIITNNNGTINWIEPNKNYDPLFIDESKNDFRVKENCESIDAGTNLFIYENETILNIPSSDYTGNNPDIGMFELFSKETIIEKLLKHSLNYALGIDDEILTEGLNLYPNPATNILTIDSNLPITKVGIYSILGQKVEEIINNFNSIPLNNLSDGIYLLRIESENGFTVKKLIKQ